MAARIKLSLTPTGMQESSYFCRRSGWALRGHGKPSQVCCSQFRFGRVLITLVPLRIVACSLTRNRPACGRERARQERWPTYGDLADMSTDLDTPASRRVLCARNSHHFLLAF